jgi:DNA/RNA endonuclease YhcR with UshA esterase domain
MALGTSLRMENLKVVDVYTTVDENTSSVGAITLTCEANGVRVSIRTIVLYDDNGNLVTEDMFIGKTIDVKGIVDYFDGAYQIKVFSEKNITIH